MIFSFNTTFFRPQYMPLPWPKKWIYKNHLLQLRFLAGKLCGENSGKNVALKKNTNRYLQITLENHRWLRLLITWMIDCRFKTSSNTHCSHWYFETSKFVLNQKRKPPNFGIIPPANHTQNYPWESAETLFFFLHLFFFFDNSKTVRKQIPWKKTKTSCIFLCLLFKK